MVWQEVVLKKGFAQRESKTHVYIRYWDFTEAINKRTGVIREAFPGEVEGYLDWD